MVFEVESKDGNTRRQGLMVTSNIKLRRNCRSRYQLKSEISKLPQLPFSISYTPFISQHGAWLDLVLVT